MCYLLRFLAVLLLCAGVSFVSLAQTASLFKDINNSGSDGSRPFGFIDLGNKLWFAAYTNANGYEPWVSDGTPAGTQLITDIWPGNPLSGITGVRATYPGVQLNGKVFFKAQDPVNGIEYWMSDGTAAGTAMLKDIWPGNNTQPYDAIGAVVYNGKIYFSAADEDHYTEVWMTDGTTAGTQLLKDIVPGSTGSNPGSYFVFNGKLFFQAARELYATDGTSAGTQMVKQINGTGLGSYPQDFFAYNGKLYFTAYDTAHGYELWSTDGTEAGTQLVRDFYSGTLSGNPNNPVAYQGKLYLVAKSPTGNVVWVLDGYTNTWSVFNPSLSNAMVPVLVYNDKLYLSGTDDSHGSELWVSDGTDAGTHLFKDLNPGDDDSEPQAFYTYNGRLYFIARDTIPFYTHAFHVWVTNGDSNSTHIILPEVWSPDGSSISNHPNFYQFQDALYFCGRQKGDDDLGPELYRLTSDSIPLIPESMAVSGSVGGADEDWAVYPNPVRDVLHIAGAEQFEAVAVYNAAGMAVYLGKASGEVISAAWPPGAYLLVVTGKDGRRYRRLLCKE